MAGITSAGPNTSNGIEAFNGNKSFSEQFNPSNPCIIDGIMMQERLKLFCESTTWWPRRVQISFEIPEKEVVTIQKAAQ
jgi:hypothetical protein